MDDIEIRVSVKSDVNRGLDAAKRQAKETGDHIAQTLARAGDKAGEGLERGIARRLVDGAEKGRGFFGRLFDGIADQAETAADAVGKSLAQIPVALSGLASSTVSTGGINLLVLALLALVAAAAAAAAGLIALAPVVYLVAGSFGAANTAAVGLAAVMGALALGLGGLSDAWSAWTQKQASGGRSAVDTAHQVKMATLSLADAQRAALQAQEAVTRAREDETERLDDLARSLAGARLDEEGAVLAVARAEQRLRDARRGSNALDYREAELGLRQAKQTLLEVQDRVGDLGREQDEANRKGVEGSDRVRNALERQRQSQRQLEQATWALAQAQRAGGGGVDKFAQAMANLSPNAQSLIKTLIALKPRFDELKFSVQDKLLAGLDDTVMRLVSRSFPALEQILGSTATSLNRLVKSTAEALGEPAFLKNIGVAVASFNGWLDRLGEKTVPKLIDAIGRLAAKSTPFFEKLGGLIAGTLENFAAWIEEADKSGKLQQFMSDAATNLQTIWDIGGDVKDILVEVVEILFPASQRESKNFLGGVKGFLDEVKRWLQDKDNRAKIQGWISSVQDFRDKVVETATKIVDLIDRFDRWVTKIDNAVSRLNAIRAGASAGLSLFGIGLPGFAHGGIVGGAASGGPRGGLTWVGEQGPELVKLPPGTMVHPAGASASMATAAAAGGGGAQAVRLVIDLQGADEDFKKMFRRWVRIDGGGSVQVAFGKN